MSNGISMYIIGTWYALWCGVYNMILSIQGQTISCKFNLQWWANPLLRYNDLDQGDANKSPRHGDKPVNLITYMIYLYDLVQPPIVASSFPLWRIPNNHCTHWSWWANEDIQRRPVSNGSAPPCTCDDCDGAASWPFPTTIATLKKKNRVLGCGKKLNLNKIRHFDGSAFFGGNRFMARAKRIFLCWMISWVNKLLKSLRSSAACRHSRSCAISAMVPPIYGKIGKLSFSKLP